MDWLSKLLLMLFLTIGFSIGPVTADENKIKSENDLVAAAKDYFSKLDKYSSGDLVTTGDVVPLIKLLKQKGWDVPQSDKLISRLIKSGSYLDQTLSSENGQRFFRQISTVSGGVDRIERMSKLKNGKGSINQLINFPHGSDLVKELATTRVGRNLGNRGSRSGASSLNESTGKIYTEKELISELARRYKADRSRRGKKS